MPEFWRKWQGWRRRDAIDADLREEMLTHIAMKTADQGGGPDRARRDFGNATLLLEDSRRAWGWPRLETWLRDVRFGLRTMARRPAFAATVVLTLALGIGSASTIFSLVDAVLIRPLPFPESSRLVAIREVRPAGEELRKPVAAGRLEDWQELNRTFVSLAGSSNDTFTETGGSAPERIPGATVSPRFFSVLAVPAALGRTFTSDEDRYGGPASIVISHGLWLRRFAADPAALGRTLVLDGRGRTIVGIMPAWFQYPAPTTDIWAPKQLSPASMQIRQARFYDCIGRLKPGVTLAAAKSDLDAVQRSLGERYPKTDMGWGAALEPLKDRLVGSVRLALWMLLGSAGVLLLITCANVACLLLSQLNGRAVEIATRRALGAGRAEVARQLFAEGVAYAMAGGVLGAAGVAAGIAWLRRLPQIPRVAELAVDARALALVIAVSVASALLFSLAPALQAFRRDLAGTLVRGGRGVIGGGQRLPKLLVVGQFALATLLLIGAAAFLRSLLHLQESPLRFSPEHVLALRVSASFNESPDAAIQRHQRALDALASLPGVEAVAMSSGLPGAVSTWPTDFHVAGEPDPDGIKRYVTTRVVTSGYFNTVRIPLVSGETCRMSTGPQQPFEALVNRRLVDQYLGGRDPVGRILTEGQLSIPLKIRGVAQDAREDGFGREPEPLIYICGYLRYWPDSDFLVRTQGDPARLAGAAVEAVRRVDPGRAVYSVRPLSNALDGTLAQNRFRAFLVSLFSAMALSLAAVGLYGLMSYMVTQRTREIGIRFAMGATPRRIVSGLLRSGGLLTGAGALAGAILGLLALRLAGSLLYGVEAFDAVTYLSSAGILSGVAFVACLIPGRRATSIDPARALREQ